MKFYFLSAAIHNYDYVFTDGSEGTPRPTQAAPKVGRSLWLNRREYITIFMSQSI